MRRSTCYSEPNNAIAGQTGTWKFLYTTVNNLPKGTKLKFDLQSQGRALDWQIPQPQSKDKTNLIWAEIASGKKALVPEWVKDEKNPSQFIFTLPCGLKASETLTICMGTTDSRNMEKKGNTVQCNVQRRKSFLLYIDPKGKKDFRDPETFHIDIRGNVLANLKIITPSLVSRNKRFDIIVRFEDRFGNLTSNAPEGTLIDLSYEHLRENLNWKLFVPETGFITLPNVYFNEPGTYKIRLKNLSNDETFFSPPIKCFATEETQLFWGLLHGESQRVDSEENIELCLRYFRDEKALQFFATSSFDNEEETSPDIWKLINQKTTEFNEDERFVTFLGFQYVGESKEEGVRQMIYLKDNKPIFRKKDTKTNSLKKIYKSIQPKELLSIPSFTMGKETTFNFEDFNSDFERIVEIYNAWGSSEMTAKESNPYPIDGSGKKSISAVREGSILKALLKGCRFGFVAGGLDDRGIYSDLYESDQTQYSPGLTAILAKDQTRTALMDALYRRSCYATTGKRIIVGLDIAGFPMGSEISTEDKPGLAFNRHITGYVIGTDSVTEIQILRNGVIFHTFEPDEYHFEFEIDDTDPLEDIVMKATEGNPPSVFYYLRAIQKDGHMAWSSPIWVDLGAGFSNKKPKKK